MERHGWHYANFRGEELLVLGHNIKRNDCMLVRLSGLPMNEASALRKIAQSRAGQEATHLTPLLRHLESPNGSDWFSYLALKSQQRNSPVFTLPIKEIQDSLDPDQKAIFKGYGKGRINTNLEMSDRARDFSGQIDEEEEIDPVEDDIPVNRRKAVSSSQMETRSGTTVHMPRDLDYKMDMMLETLVDESHRTQQLLGKLIVALTGEVESEPEQPKQAVPKPRKPVTKASASGARKKRQEVAQDGA